MNFDSKVLGQRMKVLLAASNMSQAELAEKCGQSIQTINSYANGTMVPSIDKVCRLAEALETTPNVLCGLSELTI